MAPASGRAAVLLRRLNGDRGLAPCRGIGTDACAGHPASAGGDDGLMGAATSGRPAGNEGCRRAGRRALVTVLGILGEPRSNDLFERGGHVGIVLRRGPAPRARACTRRSRASGGDGGTAAHHFVEPRRLPSTRRAASTATPALAPVKVGAVAHHEPVCVSPSLAPARAIPKSVTFTVPDWEQHVAGLHVSVHDAAAMGE